MDLKPNRVIVDGFTVHAARIGNLDRKGYEQLNEYSKKTIRTLLHALVVHDELLVGREVMGPGSRFPELFALFKDGLREIDTVLPNAPALAAAYAKIKLRYAQLGRAASYEDELIAYVQQHFFESRSAPNLPVLKRADAQLYPIFFDHSALRTQMYLQQARTLGLAYLPSPFRAKQTSNPAMWKSAGEHLLQEIVGPVRDTLEKDLTALKLHTEGSLKMPQIADYVIRDSRRSGIFSVAAQIRGSSEASAFRELCRRFWIAAVSQDLRKKREAKAELEAARTAVIKLLGVDTAEPQRVSVSIAGVSLSANFKLPKALTRPLSIFEKPAHLFLYKVANASYGLR